MRDLEAKGEIGGIYPYIYALPGVSTPVAQARRMGADVARELHGGQSCRLSPGGHLRHLQSLRCNDDQRDRTCWHPHRADFSDL